MEDFVWWAVCGNYRCVKPRIPSPYRLLFLPLLCAIIYSLLGGGVCPGGVYPSMQWSRHPPPVDRMTDRCKNTTLPQTSFAGDKMNHFSLQQFLAISVAWILSGVLTACGVFSDDPTSDGFRVSTDSKSGVLAESSFFYFPYPCTYWQYNWDFHDKLSSRSNMSFNSIYECVKLVLHIKLVVLADLVF